MSEFPFEDRPDTACFTCCHVLEQNQPILYVSHDQEGYWEFLCGKSHKASEGRIVSLASILDIDEGISDLAIMECGYFAESKDVDSDWIISKASE